MKTLTERRIPPTPPSPVPSTAVATAPQATEPVRPAPSSPPVLPVEPPAIGWFGVPVRIWIMGLFIAAAFALIYWPNFWRLWRKTAPFVGVEEWGHAIFVPIVGLYYLFLHQDTLLKTPMRPLLGLNFGRVRFIAVGAMLLAAAVTHYVVPAILPVGLANFAVYFEVLGVGMAVLAVMAAVFDWGIGSLLFGLLVSAYGIWPGQNDFVKDIGIVIVVFGSVLTITGWPAMKIAWFPIAFLICMLPWPGLFYSQVAQPLQLLAAQIGVTLMSILGVNASYEGTLIVLIGADGKEHTLQVAEACAGIKSLMTFVSLGAAVAFLSSRPLWQQLLITASAVPIAIAMNVVRVGGQGVLHRYVSEEFSSGFAHQFAGMVMILPGFVLLMGVAWLLDKMFIEVEEEEPTHAQA